MKLRLLGWMLLLALITAPSASYADENESSFSRFSWGLGAGICTLVYTPLKVVYAATTIPLGICVIRTAESVVFTCCPPAPDERVY